MLKARQFGFSTLITALFFVCTCNNADTNTVIIADAADNTEGLFAKVRLFWEMLPPEKQPATKYNNRRELYFPELRSRFKVVTAGQGAVGRSKTIHNLHCSEVPFWKNPRIMTGLLQAVPKTGNVFLESTAKGEDEVFCAEYRRAEEGTTPYAARFFAWYEHEEYETEPPTTVAVQCFGSAKITGERIPNYHRDDDDQTVAAKHDLDSRFGTERANRKLYWRRLKKSEPGQGSLFPQEYPGDAKEAFLVSGSRFFHEWDEDRHTFLPGTETIERYWQFIGGYDWGIGAPACFLLAAVSERGRVLIVDEVYGANRTDPVQAADAKACLERWNLKPAQVPIYADPSMWAQKRDQTTGALIANVNAFLAAGLLMIPAGNSRVHGWSNVKRYLHDDDVTTVAVPGECSEIKGEDGAVIRREPFLRVSRACANLIRTQSVMVTDDKNAEDADTEAEDHAWDTLRYLLSAKPRPSAPPKEPATYQSPRERRRAGESKRKL